VYQSKSRKHAYQQVQTSVSPAPAAVEPSWQRSSWWKGTLVTIAVLGLGVWLVVLFYQLDRAGTLSTTIRGFGAFGIVLCILLMAAFCVIPVPSEFLMVLSMKVFGVWWGIFYTWIGAMLGAITVFYIARYTGRKLLARFVPEFRMHQVEAWVARRGAIGLLLARLVPLPFIVVNYTAGALKSVRARDYIWTTGLGLLPYDLGAALVFLGLSRRFSIWLVAGGVAIIGFWIVGLWLQRKLKRSAQAN